MINHLIELKSRQTAQINYKNEMAKLGTKDFSEKYIEKLIDYDSWFEEEDTQKNKRTSEKIMLEEREK